MSQKPKYLLARLEQLAQGRASAYILSLIIVFITIISYLPVFNSGFIWDDDDYVYNNKYLLDAKGLQTLWTDIKAAPQYYPVVFTTFWLEHKIWGFQPGGYHAVNVGIHIIVAILLWRILKRLYLPGAWLAAAIFAVHPVHVESVAWITERKNVLSGLFYLSSALCFLRFRSVGTEKTGSQMGNREWLFYALSLLLFVAAVLSKSITSSLPAALLLILWWKTGKIRLSDALLLTPMFVIGFVSGQRTAWLEVHRVGAAGPDWDQTIAERVLIAGRALWFYLSKICWPENLMFVYPRWLVDTDQVWQWIFPTMALALPLLLLAFARKTGRGPFTAVAFFGMSLFPALGFFPVYPHRFSWVADHFQYLASIGIIALIASGIVTGCRYFFSGAGSMTRTTALAGSALISALMLLTFQHSRIFKNSETLWRETLKKNPTAWLAHMKLGSILQEQQVYDEAIAHFRKSVDLKPDYWPTHYNLGCGLAATGSFEEAVESFARAIAIEPRDAELRLNLGSALLRINRLDEAIIQLKQAEAGMPDSADVYTQLGTALAKSGRLNAAIAAFRKAAKLAPDDASTYFNLGVSLLQARRSEESAAHFRQAISIRPDYYRAYDGLARALFLLGDYRGSWEQIGLLRQAGISPDPAFLRELEAKYPLQN